MPTNVYSYKIANPATTRHGTATPSSPERRLARNDDGEGRTTNIDIIKLHFLELVMAREGRKEKAKNGQKRMVMHVPTSKTSRSLCLYTPECQMCW